MAEWSGKFYMMRLIWQRSHGHLR